MSPSWHSSTELAFRKVPLGKKDFAGHVFISSVRECWS